MWLADVPDHTIVVIALPNSHGTFLAELLLPTIIAHVSNAR